MSDKSTIEWTDATWNPIHGCSKVSPGCAHCYAETLSLRYGFTKKPWTPENASENVMLKPHKLREPLAWKKPRMVFVNSMSDLFHEDVPTTYIIEVFNVMREASQHTFQILTKRPERMANMLRNWPLREHWPNVWLGTSIENRRFVGRADWLRLIPAQVRFISAEPLLGPLICDSATAGPRGIEYVWTDGYAGPWLSLDGIDWLIVGGESGPGHRPIDPEWVRDLREAAHDYGTAFFFKQWGGLRPKSNGRELDGRVWDEMPASLHPMAAPPVPSNRTTAVQQMQFPSASTAVAIERRGQ